MSSPRARFSTGPVIVAGAGPVGLTLALRLHRAGIPVLVLEQKPEHPTDQRASTLQPGALKVYDELGLSEGLAALGHRVDSMSWFQLGKHSFTLGYHLIDGSTKYPYRLHIDQWELCGLLEDALPLGTVMWNRRVVRIEQLPDRVAVQLDDRTRLYGSFLVGADGISSTVRNLLRIPVDQGTRDTFGTFYTGPEFADRVPDASGCTYSHDGDEWTLTMRLRDGYRVLFSLPSTGANRVLVDDDRLRERLRAPFGTLDTTTLRKRRAFTITRRLATRFRKGRVFLAGDAAHVTFPADGTALNAGLLDAAALSEALATDDPDQLYAYGHDRPSQLRPWILRGADTDRQLSRWVPTDGLPDFSDGEVEGQRQLLLGVSFLAA